MVISLILGGLGNQMFQYTAGRALSLAVGEPLLLDLRYLPQGPLFDTSKPKCLTNCGTSSLLKFGAISLNS